MSHGYMDPDPGGDRQGFMVLAASRDVFAGKRIVNVSGLNQYYRDMGAYDDITPDDDDDSTFTPAQPPPVPPCAGSTGGRKHAGPLSGPRLRESAGAVGHPGRDCHTELEHRPGHHRLGHQQLDRRDTERYAATDDRAEPGLQQPDGTAYPIPDGEPMRLQTSRIRAASLLIFLMAVGLSMVAGPCYPDDAGTVVPQTLPPYVTNTPPPTIPPTATTVPNPTPTPVPTEGPSAAVEETEAPGEHEGEVSAAEAMAAAETVAPIVERTPRDVSGSLFFSPLAGGASDFRAESPTVEELLELGWFKSGASPVHIALRAAPETHSVRCEWHGIARTPAQRGKQLRFLLGSLLSDDQVLPSAADLETLLTALTSEVALGWKEKLQASYIPLATGRMNTEHLTLYCYADFVPSEYLLGSGPAKVTVAYDLRQQEFSHSVYQRIYDTY